MRGQYYIANNKTRTKKGHELRDKVPTNTAAKVFTQMVLCEKSLDRSQPRTWRSIRADRAGKVGSCRQGALATLGGKNAGERSRERRGVF